jgi:very-short-patch-repair endonuclease
MVGACPQVVELARRQHGLVAVRQARDGGMTARQVQRLVERGHWRRLRRGVYVVGAAPVTFEQRAMGALLAVGPEAMVSHRTAARLWGLLGAAPVVMEVSVPRDRKVQVSGVRVHRCRDLDLAAPCLRDGILVTGLARTLLDVASVDPDATRPAVWAARRTHGLTWEELTTTLERHAGPGRAGNGPIRRLIASHADSQAGDSRTEDRAFELLCRERHLPRPQRQVPVTCADGVAVSVDLGWPEHRAGIEIFGVDHLTNEDLQHLDAHRRNQIELTGFRLLTYTGTLLRRQPQHFVADAEQLLRHAGWTP